MFVTEFLGFFEASIAKGDRADLAQESQLAKADRAVGEGFVFDRTNNGQSDGQVDPGFVDGQTAGNIDENILGAQR